MRILIVTQYFWPENFRINDLAQGLVELGHRVTVLTGKPNYPQGRFFEGYRLWGRAQELYGSIEVRRVPLIPRGGGGGWRLALNYLSFALSASMLGPLRCPGPYDLIFVYEPSPVTVGIPARILKWRRKAPVMFWVQDLWPESLSATGAVRSPFLLKLVEQLVRWIYRGCDLVLVQSEAFLPSISLLGVDPARILYFPNSAEDLYQPVSRAELPEHGSLPKGFRVMFAGNIGAAQSVDTILGAAERLRGNPDIHWVILGEGREASRLAAEIARRDLAGQVHLPGQHPLESMPAWFAQADVLLATLRRDPIFALTVPAKIQSYMACARPIIAALDGEGGRIVTTAGCGLAVPAEDPEALAKAVLNMYNMRALEREEMGRRGRIYFEANFERNSLLRRLDHWMKRLIEGQP